MPIPSKSSPNPLKSSRWLALVLFMTGLLFSVVREWQAPRVCLRPVAKAHHSTQGW